jgi:hypothetical protein
MMGFFVPKITTPTQQTGLRRKNGFQISKKWLDAARCDAATALMPLKTTINGLSSQELESRLDEFGLNVVAKEKR